MLGGALSFTTTATAASHVRSYAVTPTGLTSSDYAIRFADGTLSVTPAPLTITADDKSKVYGQPTSPLTASYHGFVNGDGPSSLATQVRLTTTATPASPAGIYPITADSAAAADYAITFRSGTLTVTSPVSVFDRMRTAFVTTLYRDLLGRDAEAEGLRFWVQRLAAGVSSRRITVAFWRSKEHRNLQSEHRDTGIKPRTAFADAVLAARRAIVIRTARSVGPHSLFGNRDLSFWHGHTNCLPE